MDVLIAVAAGFILKPTSRNTIPGPALAMVSKVPRAIGVRTKDEDEVLRCLFRCKLWGSFWWVSL